MAVEVEELGDEAVGFVSDARYVAAAVEAAEGLVADDPSQERWVRPLVRAIKRGRLRLPSLSPTTHRLIQLIEAPEVDLDELAEVVSADPVLTMRLIGVANSSYFRGATEVPNIREALMRMGVREARTIIIVVALRSTLLRSQGLGDSAQLLWRHSILCAAAAQETTQELPPWEQSGFLAGLLHDIGQLVVLAFVSELPAWQEDGEAPDAEAVDAILAATHSALGALVLASWGFPDPFCEAILTHHDSSAASEEVRILAVALELTDAIAHQVVAGWPEEESELDPSLIALAETLGLDAERLTDLAEEAAAACEALSKLS